MMAKPSREAAAFFERIFRLVALRTGLRFFRGSSRKTLATPRRYRWPMATDEGTSSRRTRNALDRGLTAN